MGAIRQRHRKAKESPQVFSLENQVSWIAITMDSTSSPRLRNPPRFLWFTRFAQRTGGSDGAYVLLDRKISRSMGGIGVGQQDHDLQEKEDRASGSAQGDGSAAQSP